MFIYNNQDKFALDKDKKITFHGLRHFYCQNRYKELIKKFIFLHIEKVLVQVSYGEPYHK